ncbi:MAG: hypothetical protein V5A36_00330 [Natronomonas sp.]
MTPDLDPRPEKRRTRDGAGPRWDVIRTEVLDRDDYTCQRCGVECANADRLEVHNTSPLGSPSLEDLDRLLTVCRPCHATLHGDDPAYGDLSDEAPMFPQPDAPAPVATMRSDRQHICQRCQSVAETATELAAYVDGTRPYALCKPCAGALLEAGYDPATFETAGGAGVETLRRLAPDAPVRPTLLAPSAVRAPRPPRTKTERIVHDTPLRYAINPIGLTILFILVGVALSVAFF